MLDITWFVLVAVIFVAYFFLEGFDYGVGMLLPFMGRTDHERRVVLTTIGPFWDGNEVWLIAAGGAIFAAFPDWYASMLSGFYLAIFLLLGGLILRGVSIEFRSRMEGLRWRRWWDMLFFIGSILPPLIWGVALANLVKGMPINAQGNYVGTLLQLLNPFALVGGLTVVAVFILHGATFLMLRATGELYERAKHVAFKAGPVVIGVFFIFILMMYYQTDVVRRLGLDPGPVPVLAWLSILGAEIFARRGHDKWAFVSSGLAIVLGTVSMFLAMFPDVMISSLNPRWSLTIYNASSNPYSLKVMTIMAVVMLPIIVAYQAWSYWIFRRRLTDNMKLEY